MSQGGPGVTGAGGHWIGRGSQGGPVSLGEPGVTGWAGGHWAGRESLGGPGVTG